MRRIGFFFLAMLVLSTFCAGDCLALVKHADLSSDTIEEPLIHLPTYARLNAKLLSYLQEQDVEIKVYQEAYEKSSFSSNSPYMFSSSSMQFNTNVTIGFMGRSPFISSSTIKASYKASDDELNDFALLCASLVLFVNDTNTIEEVDRILDTLRFTDVMAATIGMETSYAENGFAYKMLRTKAGDFVFTIDFDF